MPHYADTSRYTTEEHQLWEQILAHAGENFKTKKGLPFTYSIKGNEILISRKEKSITRASLNLAYHKMKAGSITGPKQLGVFGASYLYVILVKIEQNKMQNRNNIITKNSE